MKIGFDISQTGAGKAGCGFFAAMMIRELAQLDNNNLYRLYTSFGDFFFDPSISLPQQTLDAPRISDGPKHHSLEEAASFWTTSDLEQDLQDVDIIHSNNFWCPRQLRTARLVYTLYDLSFLHDPSWTTETNRVGCFQGVFGAAVAADWIVAISQASRQHFLTTFPSFPPDRVKVIFPGSRFSPESASQKPPGLESIQPGEYWLAVGTIEPRKNHERLVEAFAAYLSKGGPPLPLVIAGGQGWLMNDFREKLAGLNIPSKVIITGYVSDEQLVWLYQNCFANVYVSLFEGFGLPVLEGMTFGCPTIASRSTSIPEITGDAAVLVDPVDVDDMTNAFLRLANDDALRAKLSAAGRARAELFQWRKSAEQLSELYELALASPKRSGSSGASLSREPK